MLPSAVVREVRRLLVEEGLSQRKVARMTGVSRGTIGRIATGRRSDYPERDPAEDQPQGPPERCGGCGGLVYMPCRLCRVRAAGRQPEPKQKTPPNETIQLGLELSPEHHARYEAVRAKMLQMQRDGLRGEEAA